MYRELNYQDRVLRYQRVGAGTTVVLLHGFGEDGTVWAFQKDFLSKHFQLLIPDLPGSGGSQRIDDMSMEGLAEAVHHILKQEGIETCIMIGHSMGGYITLTFAEKWNAMLKGFGLFHSSAYADSDDKKATRKKGIAFIKQHGPYEFLKTAIPNTYSPATKEANPALIEQQTEAGRAFTAEALVAYYEAMMQRPDRTALLENATVPVLLVMGRWDTAVPLQDGLAQSYLPQLAYIHVLELSAHMGMVEKPDAANDLLYHYISETAGAL